MIEEQAYAKASGLIFSTHNDVIANHNFQCGAENQKIFYFPKMATGETIGCLAIIEPQCGSDIQSIQTTAKKWSLKLPLTSLRVVSILVTKRHHCNPLNSSWQKYNLR